MQFSLLATAFVVSVLFTVPLYAQGIGPPDQGIGAPTKDYYRALEPLDKTHSNNQRIDIKRRFIDMGYQLKTDETDLKVMHKMLILGKIQRNDIATQQAMGLVLGDILAKRLNMEWIIIHDKVGRSRALRYQKTDIVVFPVTLISRRYKTGLNVDIQALYDKTVQSVEKSISLNQQRRRYY